MKTILEQRSAILKKIEYAKNYTPHKIEYYKDTLKEFDFKNIGYYKYESLKVRIYWKGILQTGIFYSANEALNYINVISGGYNKYYSIHTPNAVIELI